MWRKHASVTKKVRRCIYPTFEAEVDGAIYSSTVTNSGPFMELTSKHSIYPHRHILSLTDGLVERMRFKRR